MTTIKSGLGGAIGCRYDSKNDRLIFVEYDNGNLSSINKVSTGGIYQVLGTGYTHPEDVALTSDGAHAYVTERSGDLVYVNLSAANRASAVVVTSGMTTPQQIALDEAHGFAYSVEYANPGKLWRVNLTNGNKTALLSNLQNAVGVLITSDSSTAYIGEQVPQPNGQVIEVNLMTLQTRVLIAGLTNPYFLTWANANETGIITTERDPANRVTQIELTLTTATTRSLATGVPFRPSSVAVQSPGTLFLCSDAIISKVNLSSYTSAGPIILGVGNVPFNYITSGFANTMNSPGLPPFQDSPFGGTLPILINSEAAANAGALYYTLAVDGVQPQQGYTDYVLNSAGNFAPHLVSPIHGVPPDTNGYYPLHKPSDVWLDFDGWLGYMLDTSGLTNGPHTIAVTLYSNTTPTSAVSLTAAPLAVQIDNTLPTASIDQILHDGAEAGPCAIVNWGTDSKFTFAITATSPSSQPYLLSWSLDALWGGNKTKNVAFDDYGNHVTSSRSWVGFTGIIGANPPPPAPINPWDASVAGDPTSTNCAHTFRLGVWDRVIDGVSYIHYAEYDDSVTIMLP